MSKKIYCKNCKYYDFLRIDSCGKVLGRVDIPEKKGIKIYGKSYNENKNNNCQYYHRKWWKFWIK